MFYQVYKYFDTDETAEKRIVTETLVYLWCQLNVHQLSMHRKQEKH